MPPHIIRLGREPLFGEHKAAFESALRKSNGKIHVITHPTSLEVPMNMMRTTEFKDGAVMAQAKGGLIEKVYDHGDMLGAFADKYYPKIHRILAADEPKIVFVEEKDLDTVEARIRNGWMKPISDFSEHVGERNKPLLTSSDANSTIILVPTMLKDPTPIHGWGPIEKTLGGVNMPKSLEISGTYMVTDPRDGSVMRACPTEIRDQLQRRKSAIGASSIKFNREASFPDIEGLRPKKHAFHEGRVRSDFGTFIMPHKPGFADAALAQVRGQILEKSGRQEALQAKKIGRNDPCPCGSGLKYKRCHGG